jgi:hypothetical protein
MMQVLAYGMRLEEGAHVLPQLRDREDLALSVIYELKILFAGRHR